MFIVSNGAFKCGSTWLHRIAVHLVSPRKIPEEFQNPGFLHQSVQPRLFGRFLEESDVTSTDYVSANHARTVEARATLLSDERVRVLNITRDLRDVLVSAYYHDRRQGRVDGDINAYWADLGRRRIAQVLDHHRMWNTGHSQVFVASYEALQASFEAQVGMLAAFLGLDKFDIQHIREETDIGRLRAKADRREPHQRKGIVGDWRNHLSDDILAELSEAAERLEVSHPSAASA